MIKQYCDRCGQEIKEPRPGLLNHRVFYGKVWLDSLRWQEREDYKNYLLCKKCEDSFHAWIHHLEGDRKRNERG